MLVNSCEIKGLVIDYDSLTTPNIDTLEKLNNVSKCIFITSSLENKNILLQYFKEDKILYLDYLEQFFSPSINTHGKVLDMLMVINIPYIFVGDILDINIF